ncbi:MAG: hypothetical protein U9R38_04520 [Candidatus Margulisiibacteriota bacterium]|nr:hypothetical protein [Candidatus Margulisiibacteriota bacterium]
MKKIIVVSCLLLVVSYLIGCGLKTETTRYFYGPSWVRDGKVIFVGEVNTADKDVLGSQIGSSYSQYLATMYSAGTGESSSLIDTTATSAYSLSCSPATDYVAYMIGLRNGLFSTIVIRNIATGVHTGLEMVELNFSPGIKAFDWSPDGARLAYCTTTEVRIVDVDGDNDDLVIAEANLEFVSWQNGGRIAFVRASESDKLLSLIYSDGSGRVDLTAAQSVDLPQISSTNTDEVYGIVSDSLQKVDVGTTTRTAVIASGFTGSLPRLSPDATKVTYSKTGENTGVYVYNLTTSLESEVK